jgi:chemotaxis protein CheX
VTQEAEVGIFIDSVLGYFSVTVQHTAQCGTPYLAIGRSPEVSDYTAMIKISGKRAGIVYFTAPRSMLSVMLMRMQETDMSHENLCDLVGEIANTFAGNARRGFGHQFIISVPTVVCGHADPMEYPAGTRPIVIPIDWRAYKARLVVCLN